LFSEKPAWVLIFTSIPTLIFQPPPSSWSRAGRRLH
jgi:hypothetical protein